MAVGAHCGASLFLSIAIWVGLRRVSGTSRRLFRSSAFPISATIEICHLRGLLIQWSVKVERWMGDSILGMWQVVQFFVLTGQAAPG